jgi:hypothetical protein
MWDLRQHTLLDIFVGYVAPRATHFTGYCCWFTGASGNTLYCVFLWVMQGFGQHTSLGLMWGAFINGFKIILFLIIVEKSKCRFPYLLQNKQNHMALLSCFPINVDKCATIRQISYSQTCTFPQTVQRMGMLVQFSNTGRVAKWLLITRKFSLNLISLSLAILAY